jgi:hypothetical protein
VRHEAIDQRLGECGLADIGATGNKMVFLAWTASAKSAARFAVSIPASTSLAMVNQCGRSFRILSVTPFNEQGGKTAATREPPGSPASNSALDSLMS